MSNINLFIKSLGISDDVIAAIEGAENEEAVMPIVEQVRSNIYTVAREDADYKAKIKTDTDGLLIGKEKSLKKNFAKGLGLTLTSSEVEGMTIEDIAKKAKETFASSNDSSERIEQLIKANHELTEKIDELTNSHKGEIDKLVAKHKKDNNSAKINSELITLIPKLVNVAAENVTIVADTVKALAIGKGYEIDITEKGDLKLYSDGKEVIKNNSIYGINDFIKTELSGFFGTTHKGGNAREVQQPKPTGNMTLQDKIKQHNAKYAGVN